MEKRNIFLLHEQIDKCHTRGQQEQKGGGHGRLQVQTIIRLVPAPAKQKHHRSRRQQPKIDLFDPRVNSAFIKYKHQRDALERIIYIIDPVITAMREK